MTISDILKGLPLVEVAVIFVVILVLASLAVPSFQTGSVWAPETNALSNANQIGLACKQYAIDHNGQFPTFVAINGTTTSTRISDYSNTAFDQLIPDYLTTRIIFYQPKSAWTPNALPALTTAQMVTGKSLPAGSNEWAYVTGLRDTSNPDFPLIANGFANLKTHAYTTVPSALGGVLRGVDAIVIFCNDSGAVIKCTPTTHTIPGSPNGADLFDTSGQLGWLTSTGTNPQTVLNPAPPAKPPWSLKAWFFW